MLPVTAGAQVRLYVNKLTSTKTQIPFDYYSLPFCHPNKIQVSVICATRM